MLSLNNSLNINLSQPINSKDASTGAHFDAGFWCHYQVAFWQAFKKVADVEPAAVAYVTNSLAIYTFSSV